MCFFIQLRFFGKFWYFSKCKYIPATASVCNAGCYQLLCRNIVHIENYRTLIMKSIYCNKGNRKLPYLQQGMQLFMRISLDSW